MTEVILSMLTVGGIGAVLAVALELADRYIANYGEVTIDINDGKREFITEGGSSLLSALIGQGIFIPSACGGKGSCGYCKCKVTDGAGPVLPTEEGWLTEAERKDDVRLSCQIKLRNDIQIRIPEELFSIKQYAGMIERITERTYDIKEVYVRLEEPSEMDFQSGQYMQIETQEYGDVDESVYRAYSMSGSEDDKNHVEFLIRRVPGGICTTWVHDYLKEGDKITLNGPHGDFFLRDVDRPIIFIAGGSGMAPFKGMLSKMAADGNNRKCTFFFGAVSKRDLYHLELMSDFEKKLPNFKFVPALSAPAPEDNWTGATGLITEVVDRMAEDIDKCDAYLCGSPGMIDACIAVLTKRGLTEDRIFYDKFA